ncbi:hypothetical protein ACU686_03380 [Yinghuangia aomiensis]
MRTLDTDDILTLHQTSANGQFASSWFNFCNLERPGRQREPEQGGLARSWSTTRTADCSCS